MPIEKLLLDLLLGFGIGLSLGLLGGGGSILTVPALVYLVGLSPQAAATTSLAIVGINSALGVLAHKSCGVFNGRVALLFGGAGMLVSYLAAGLSGWLSPALLLVLFSLLMLVVGASMAMRKDTPTGASNPPRPGWVTPASGAGVGLLTGFLGVGGGFLIVPSLVMLVGLPMGEAVSTSLAIIAANSLAGFLGHLQTCVCDLPLIATFVTAGLGGTFLGARLVKRLPARLLRLAFAALVIILALLLLWDNLPALW
ncbi:MAG: sulfite exporter TauE/SafE family protein [Chloroflexota bacterium]